MNKTQFAVDSGEILNIDPRFLDRFAEHFSYQDFVDHAGPGQNPQEYINDVAKKAFPQAQGQIVGSLRSDGLYGDTEFVGHGRYEISSRSVRMTSAYLKEFKAWLEQEKRRVRDMKAPRRRFPRVSSQ